MKIKLVAVGNKEEAFVENRIKSNFNIISSDDNNRGKTIIIQSMLYALGNEPTFPESFEYKKYYYYIEFEVNNNLYCLCRKDTSYVLKVKNELMLFDNLSDLKRYWTKNIFELPTIVKGSNLRIVDPVLFMQMFFVGQDKKDTSNIAKNGFYNKSDFIEMLFSYMHISGTELGDEEISSIKNKIQQLKNEKTVLLKQHKILKSNKKAVSFLSAVNDRIVFEQKIEKINIINDRISELKKARDLLLTRRAKWHTTIKELNSLNNTIDFGELRCMDCNSKNIAFFIDKKSTYTFDVSTAQMRKNIISSINEKIDAYTEEIENITHQLNQEQDKLKYLLKDEEVTLESIVLYKQDVFSAEDAEKNISNINKKLKELNEKITANEILHHGNQIKQTELLNSIINKMNTYYKQIDNNGNLIFEGLFTKRDVTYSGSESTVFHLVKMLAIQNILNHTFPIVIDSFRAEDLSTAKEEVVLSLFKDLDNQIIFTTTLKKEESGKYKNVLFVNNIDYQTNHPSKILQPNYTDEFKKLLSNMSIKI